MQTVRTKNIECVLEQKQQRALSLYQGAREKIAGASDPKQAAVILAGSSNVDVLTKRLSSTKPYKLNNQDYEKSS